MQTPTKTARRLAQTSWHSDFVTMGAGDFRALVNHVDALMRATSKAQELLTRMRYGAGPANAERHRMGDVLAELEAARLGPKETNTTNDE